MPRDILWVLPNGTTTVVTVDDDGNPVEPIAPVVPEPEAKPEPVKRKPRRK